LVNQLALGKTKSDEVNLLNEADACERAGAWAGVFDLIAGRRHQLKEGGVVVEDERDAVSD
jgi:hypothetical protein